MRQLWKGKAALHRRHASLPLPEKVRLVMELQRIVLPLIARQRPLRSWERPWEIEPYPWASSGFFIKGGAGLSIVDMDVFEGTKLVTVDLGDGFGAIAGIGYDLRIRRNMSITPVCNFYLGWPGDLKVGLETVARNWKFNVLELSVGITFH